MSKSISNFQIENAIENIEDNDLRDNFIGVFPLNYLNKFINHAATISDKKDKIPSLLLRLAAVKKELHTGGVYLI